MRLLNNVSNYNVTYHNHGHGATEITCKLSNYRLIRRSFKFIQLHYYSHKKDTIFCVDIEKYSPDLVLIDFSVNDYGHPKFMEALLRKVMLLESHPIILLVNLWVKEDCPVTRYSLHSFYYQLPLINICPAVDLCFGKKHLPAKIADQYSKTDGVHPWGPMGVKFIGEIFICLVE